MSRNETTQNDLDNTGFFERFVSHASNTTDGAIGTRAGFGALRNFQSVSDNSIRLAIDSGFFAPPREKGDEPWIGTFDPEFWHFYGRRYPRQQFRHFVNRVLSSPSYYHPRCMWALFWALAKAEHEFLFRYVPFWSHEEQLTGHFVSQIMERTHDFKELWLDLDLQQFGEKTSELKIYYADTAAGRREALTGADLGFIVHAVLPKQREFFKVARFQAKKVSRSGNARIDLDQTRALMRRPELGYYLFYHFLDEKTWSLAPTVGEASNYKQKVEEVEEIEKKNEKRPKEKLGEVSLPARSDGYDFATFVTFGLSDPAAEHGVMTSSPTEALRVLMAGTEALSEPSRVMIVTLGSPPQPPDWNEILREHIGYQLDGE